MPFCLLFGLHLFAILKTRMLLPESEYGDFIFVAAVAAENSKKTESDLKVQCNCGM